MFKSSLTYTAVSLFNKGIPFLLLPLLTAYLAPTDYGILALVQMVISFIFPIQNLNGNLFISKKYPLLNDQETRAYIVSHTRLVFYISIFLIFLISLILFIFSDEIQIDFWWFIIIVIIGVLNSFYLDYTTLLRCENRALEFAVLEIVKTTLNVALSLLLVILVFQSWESRIIAILTSVFVFGAIVLILFWKRGKIEFKADKKQIKEILSFSLPLLPFSIGMIVVNLSDRLFIEYYIGTADLGIYSVAYTVGMIVLLFGESFNKAWAPYFFQLMLDYKVNKAKILKIIVLYSIGLILTPPVVYLFAKLVVFEYFINIDYYDALQYILGIAYSYVFYGIYLVLFQFLAWKDKTKIIGNIFVFSAILNLILNYFMIVKYGLHGAVLATLITYFVMLIIILFYVLKYYRKNIVT